jgi:Protein of unknown function (DUF3224)
MRAEGTFDVVTTTPAELVPPPEPIEVGLPVGVMTFVKEYAGEVAGRSATVFVAAYDMGSGVGSYVAMESFAGSLAGTDGGFAYAHAATTTGGGREDEFFTIVPSSGSGGLATIRGAGGMRIEEDGTHRIWFDYELD